MSACPTFMRQKARRLAGPCLLALWACLLLASCQSAEEDPRLPRYGSRPASSNTRYLLGVHPLHNPEKLHAVYGPLVARMNEALFALGAEVVLEASRSYESFEAKLKEGRFHLALPNPYQAVKAKAYGYSVFAKARGDENFCGIVLVRAECGITSPQELKGKTVAYPAPTALAAAMLPQMFFAENGLDVMRDLDNLYVGSQESVIMSVYTGRVQAGCTWPVPWMLFERDNPEAASQLRVLWRTPSLPNMALMRRSDVPQAVVDAISEALAGLASSENGKAVLAAIPAEGFEPADNSAYQPVCSFLKRFQARVRPLDD